MTDNLNNKAEEKIPDDDFKCPITLDYLKEPVMAQDGHFYEKSAIENWFKTHDNSPLTRQKIDKKLSVCYFFNNKLDEFNKTNNIVKQITEKDLMSQHFKIFDETYISKYLEIMDDMNINNLVIVFKNKDFIDFLIKYQPINYKDTNKWMLIHYICAYGTFDMLKKLIESSKDIDLEAQTDDNWRPIHIICSISTNMIDKDRINAIKLMIKYDIDINFYTNNNNRPIDLICELDKIISKEYYIEAVQLLINAGARVKRLKIDVE